MRRAWVSLARAVRRVVLALGVDLGRRPGDGRLRIWLVSLLGVYDVRALTALDVPWWTFAAADEVERFLAARPAARVFEWGAGASSVWLASRAGSVTSVEHDAAWADEIEPLLPGNVTLRRVPAPAAAGPDAVRSSRRGERHRDFRAYVAAIDDEDGAFDLVVVDGRAREACLARAVRRVAPGGLVVLDNVDRARYRRAMAEHAGDLRVRVTRGLTPALPYPTRTALLRRDPAG